MESNISLEKSYAPNQSSENEIQSPDNPIDQTDIPDTPVRSSGPLLPIPVRINKVAPIQAIKIVKREPENEAPKPGVSQKFDRMKTNLAITEDITLCPICNDNYEDPHSLPCSHVFCRNCIVTSVVGGKIECCLCAKMHSVPRLDQAIKPSSMTKFLVKFKKNKFDNIEITSDERKEQDGICLECDPPEKNKKSDPNEPEIEPILVTLSKCFHCDEQLCNSCCMKHYNSLRKETLKSLIYYGEGSDNIVNTSEKLNDARKDKIVDYEKYKIDIAERKVQLMDKLDKEEINLLNRLDEEITLEKRNIELGNLKLNRHVVNRDLTKTVYTKVVNEKNFKRLNEMCGEFLEAQTEWKVALNGEAASIDPSKETKVHFNATKLKDEIIGNIDQKKGNLKIQNAVIPGSKKSSICTII